MSSSVSHTRARPRIRRRKNSEIKTGQELEKWSADGSDDKSKSAEFWNIFFLHVTLCVFSFVAVMVTNFIIFFSQRVIFSADGIEIP